MTPPGASSVSNALFLSPEAPVAGAGGGGLRSACLLAYLRARYSVEVASFELPHHSKTLLARAWRNGWRFLRGVPPLYDRYSGFESQLDPVLRGRRYAVGVIEHFWCASYAAALRPYCDRLVLDLHNVESELTRSYARAASGLDAIAGARFAEAYKRLERRWFPEFDLILAASEEDRRRVDHPAVHVFPNALPEIERPQVNDGDWIVFSGNLEYHPNVQAVRWFYSEIWPRVREAVRWRLIGRNPDAVKGIIAGDSRIELTGPVDDAIAAIAEAKICIVPLLSGSGTRFKILEAWAASRAVVSTSLGAEGLGGCSGDHLMIADNPAEFANAILRLLAEPDLRHKLGEAGRALYLDHSTWTAAWKALEAATL
jgi:glycosyltransferase involved in cell wall biosynthesis